MVPKYHLHGGRSLLLTLHTQYHLGTLKKQTCAVEEGAGFQQKHTRSEKKNLKFHDLKNE